MVKVLRVSGHIREENGVRVIDITNAIKKETEEWDMPKARALNNIAKLNAEAKAYAEVYDIGDTVEWLLLVGVDEE
jgi:hypothetical protein